MRRREDLARARITMHEPKWKTRDGRLVKMKDMSDLQLEATIRYLEAYGVEAVLMTPEQLEEDPVARAELLMGRMNEGHGVKYKELLTERERRKFELRRAQALIAAERPGAPVEREGTEIYCVTSLGESLRRLSRR